MQSDLLNLLPHFDVISFDVFDTLLLRPYLKPTDLFRKIGGEKFRQERVLAERNAREEARRSGREEVTYEEIYAKLPQWIDLKARELEEEQQCLTANPEAVEIFNAAKAAGKKVVIASDMYLPRVFLEKVLRQQGIDGWDAFYLSSDCGVQKASGKMFRRIAVEMGVVEQRILHIGDNLYADVNMPESVGIGTWWLPKISDVFFSENPYALQFARQHSDAQHEDFVGILALSNHLEKFRDGYSSREKLSCIVGGPVVYSFVKWMINDARHRGINRFLFVARDGFTPKRLVRRIAPDFRVDYIYAPRSVSKPVREGKPVRHDYLEYIRSLKINANTTAIVDGNTEFFSSQKLIDACLGEQCMGYYFIRTNNYGRCASYYHLLQGADFNICMFLESLYCAPTMPVVDVKDKQPVYFENDTPYEQERAKKYMDISDAIVRTALFLESKRYQIVPKVLFEWLEAFFQNMPLTDALYLSHIKNAVDINHTCYYSVQLQKRPSHVWKRLFFIPFWILKNEIDGYVRILHARFLGLIPFKLRYRIVHEENEGYLLGDALKSISRRLCNSHIVCEARKLYRYLVKHGEITPQYPNKN